MESRQLPAHSRSQCSLFVTWRKWAGTHRRSVVIRNFVQAGSRWWWNLVGHQFWQCQQGWLNITLLSAEILQHSLGFVVHTTLWNSGTEDESPCVVGSKSKVSLWAIAPHKEKVSLIGWSTCHNSCAFLWCLRHFRIFPFFFLVTIERLGTGNGNKYSLQAAQARSERWALNQCSEQQLPAFVIQSKRSKGFFASIWAYYHPEGKTNC